MWVMLFTYYLVGFGGTLLCSVGIVLTLCSVYVFTRRQMRSTVATYLAGLSLSDSCILSLGLLFAINSSIPPDRQSEFYYSSFLYKSLFPYIYGCFIWFQFTSVWITIAFAIDRWFAIRWPIIHYTYSSKRACYIVISIYGFGFLYSLPRFFEYETIIRQENLTLDNETEYIYYYVTRNKMLNNFVYQYTVHIALYCVFQSILPLLMLSYFNVELIRNVNASSNFLKRFATRFVETRRIRGEKDISKHRESAITRSVISLIGLFILCQVPASILHFVYMFYRNHPILYICYDISNFLILVNCTTNFFIFTYFNGKFRRALPRLCFQNKLNQSLLKQTLGTQSIPHESTFRRAKKSSPQLLSKKSTSPKRCKNVVKNYFAKNDYPQFSERTRRFSCDSSIKSDYHHSNGFYYCTKSVFTSNAYPHNNSVEHHEEFTRQNANNQNENDVELKSICVNTISISPVQFRSSIP